MSSPTMSSRSESRNGYKNRILASLSNAEISRLSPNLSPLDLPSGKVLMDPAQEIADVYFLETGLASVVVPMTDGNIVEAGITGNDGLIDYSRGKLLIRNRKGLELAACECYRTVKNEFDRLGIFSNVQQSS
jgi:hypothetical protein